ncbi:MAG: zinc ribbon domain-containing protein [Patescibacteria group bacterium]|jgi:putative FmdB family regulatory protein
MPLYEYRCLACSHQLIELQSINDELLQVCPKCSGKLKKIISLCSPDINYQNSKEYYEKVIKPDAKRIAKKIKSGDEESAANIFGDK